MPDRKKVVKELERLSEWLFHMYQVVYDGDASTYYDAYKTVDDAIALLKEREPKQVEAEVINEIDRLYRCPSCHISMILRNQPYCHSCGQAVKWE